VGIALLSSDLSFLGLVVARMPHAFTGIDLCEAVQRRLMKTFFNKQKNCLWRDEIRLGKIIQLDSKNAAIKK